MVKKQFSFEFNKKFKTAHGGKFARGKRKCARPITTKEPMHIVLKSSKACGQYNMLRKVNLICVENVVRYYAKINYIKIYNYANVGNHLHILVRTKSREGFKRFLKTITARIAVIVTGAKKGTAFGKFWDDLAFTRIVKWGRDYVGTQLYLTKNLFEGDGIVMELASGGFRRFYI